MENTTQPQSHAKSFATIAFLIGLIFVVSFVGDRVAISRTADSGSSAGFSEEPGFSFAPRTDSTADESLIKSAREETNRLKALAVRSEAAALEAFEQTERKDLPSVAENRKKLLLQLLDKNPALVSDLMISSEERRALPAEAQAFIEEYVEVQGTLEASIFESFAENEQPYHKKLFALKNGTLRQPVYFGDMEPEGGNGTRVRIKGYKLDNNIFIPQAEAGLELDPNYNNSPKNLMQEAAVANAAVSSNIPFKVAVILFNFSDDTSQPTDVSFWRDAVFTGGSIALRSFYQEISFGKMTAQGAVNASVGDIYGYVTIPASKNVCNQYLWADQAQAAAASSGYVASRYDSVILVHPRTGACAHDGGGDLGSTVASGLPARTWINGNFIKEVLYHEVGHNLNVMHANLKICTSGSSRVPFSTTCTNQEYGDSLDIMGYRITRHQNAFMKQKIGLFSSANIKTVTASGSYTIYPIEKTSSQPQGLRISRNSTEWIYVDFRRPYGYDAYPSTHPAVKGVTIHIVPKNGFASYLLDTTPGSKPLISGYYAYTPDFEDGALGVGKTVSIGNIKIKTVSAGTTSAKVQVTLP